MNYEEEFEELCRDLVQPFVRTSMLCECLECYCLWLAYDKYSTVNVVCPLCGAALEEYNEELKCLVPTGKVNFYKGEYIG